MNNFIKFLTANYAALDGKKKLIGSAAGPWSIGWRSLHELFLKYDFVVGKTVTRRPHIGNTGKIISFGDDFIVNNIGLRNCGIDQFQFAEVIASQYDKPFIHSFAPANAAEVEEICELYDIVEFNISCPNYQTDLNLNDVLRAIPYNPNKLFGLKLSPVESYDWSAINKSNCDFVTAFNTIPVEFTSDHLPDLMPGETFRGGYSGPVCFGRALSFVKNNNLNKPIIFCGGIRSKNDIITALEHCSAIQIGTHWKILSSYL